MKFIVRKPTSAPPDRRCKDPIPVEKRLKKVCKKLNITEVNIGLFHRMVKSGVVTNDVRGFIENQQQLKRSASSPSKALLKAAMKQKLTDACSTAGRLRREKRRLQTVLSTACMYTKSKTKRVVKKITYKIKVGFFALN